MEFIQYKAEATNKKGEQRSNLSFQQRKGLEKLQKRIKNKEVVAVMTDKTGRIVIISMEMYLKMGEVHTSKDDEISWDAVWEKQKLLNGHVSLWIKIGKIGEDWNHTERVRETCINKSCSIPPMYLLWKDHKESKDGDTLKSRPVISSQSGMGIHLNNILTDFVDPLADCIEGRIEVISGSEMLHRVDSLNKLIEIQEKEKGNIDEIQEIIDLRNAVLTGSDAVGLYPSLLKISTGNVVREEAMKSTIKWEGLDYKECARYIAIHYEPWEIKRMKLQRVIPKRRFHKGAKPGVKGKEAQGKEAGDEEKWDFPTTEYTDLEKKNMMASCLEIGVRAIYDLHTYQFGGKIFAQTDGGPIGLSITGACSKVVMGVWSVKVNKILVENNIQIWLASGYVDDMRYLTSSIREGVRWCDKEQKMVEKEEWRVEDTVRGENREQRTSREILKVMNSVYKNIQFTREICQDFRNGRLPTLDFTLWIEQGEGEKTGDRVHYSFYEKELGSKFCIMEKGAMSEQMKRSTLSQEVIRRMVNTSEMVEQVERNKILEVFAEKMSRSGYSRKTIQEILVAGLKGYEAKRRTAKLENRGIHRSSRDTQNKRIKNKLLGKTTWYKKKKKKGEGYTNQGGFKEKMRNGRYRRGDRKENEEEDTPISAVMFVPRTHRGELATRLRQAESDIQKVGKTRVKIVEETGNMAKSLIHKANPWAGEKCTRSDCMICNTGEKNGDCRRRNVCYQTWCQICKEKGRDTMYLGETGRTGYERAREHVGDWKSRKEDSHMHEHGEKEHRDTEGGPHFGMKILKSHRSALERQIHEAVLISNSWQKEILNSKQEYNRCIIPRLAVIVGAQVKGDTDGEAKIYQESELRELEDNGKGRKRYTVERSQQPTKRRKRWHQEEKLAGKRRCQGDRPDTVKRRRTATEIQGVVMKGVEKGKNAAGNTQTGGEKVNKILEMFEKLKKKGPEANRSLGEIEKKVPEASKNPREIKNKVPEASRNLRETKKKAPEAPECQKVEVNPHKNAALVIGCMMKKRVPEAPEKITGSYPLPKPTSSQNQSEVRQLEPKPENDIYREKNKVSHRILITQNAKKFKKPKTTNLTRGGKLNPKIDIEKHQKITNFFQREGKPEKSKNPSIKFQKCPGSSANGQSPTTKPNQLSLTQACYISTKGGGEHSKTTKPISPGIKEKIRKLAQISSPTEQVKMRHRPPAPDKDLQSVDC